VNWRANRLAHHLRFLGSARDARRCLDGAIARADRGLLGILKAGGLVPFDLASLADRIGYMLQDADLRPRRKPTAPPAAQRALALDPGTGMPWGTRM
jgi:non-ribosomal peptide synthetase component F